MYRIIKLVSEVGEFLLFELEVLERLFFIVVIYENFFFIEGDIVSVGGYFWDGCVSVDFLWWLGCNDEVVKISWSFNDDVFIDLKDKEGFFMDLVVSVFLFCFFVWIV